MCRQSPRLARSQPPGSNHVVGRLSKLNTSGVAGIRFTRVAAASGPILRVEATWQDQRGRAKAMMASNFRVTGLPFDAAGITQVGLPLLRRTDAASDPRRAPL